MQQKLDVCGKLSLVVYWFEMFCVSVAPERTLNLNIRKYTHEEMLLKYNTVYSVLWIFTFWIITVTKIRAQADHLSLLQKGTKTQTQASTSQKISRHSDKRKYKSFLLHSEWECSDEGVSQASLTLTAFSQAQGWGPWWGNPLSDREREGKGKGKQGLRGREEEKERQAISLIFTHRSISLIIKHLLSRLVRKE